MESGMNTAGFGYFLRDIRENGKISLRRLAQETMLDPAYLSRMEREMSPAPRVEIVQRIAKALCGLQNLSMAECEKLKRDLLDSAGQLTDDADLINDLKQRFAERLRDQGIAESYIIDAVNKVSLEAMDRVLSGQEKLEIADIGSLSSDVIKERESKGEEIHSLKNKKACVPLPPRRVSKTVKKTKLQAGSRAFIEVDGDLTPYQKELLSSVANTVRFILKGK
jgi:transcriptional regulator with XRE-family HTH domain